MTKFDSALSVMVTTIFPNDYDAKSCSRQANVLFDRARALSVHNPDEPKLFSLAIHWNRQAIKIIDEQREQIHHFDRIFGDFIQESWKQQRLSKRRAAG